MFFRKKENKNRKLQLVIIIVIILTTVFLKLYSISWPNAEINVSGKVLNVLIADTYDHRYKGWGDRDDMGQYDGMAFVYNNYNQHTMVMRDMNFSLDIVWGVSIDGEGKKCLLNSFGPRKMITGLYHGCVVKIVDLAPNVKPERDTPEIELIPYFSREKSTIVFEFKAGFSQENNLKIGDIIEIFD